MLVQQPHDQDDGPSSYMPYGASGGGGAGGQYVFADLAELDTIITDLETLVDDIRKDGHHLADAVRVAKPPAEDSMSTGQASAYVTSLGKALAHHDAMLAYAEHQLDKLKAARETYAVTDANSAALLRSIDGNDR